MSKKSPFFYTLVILIIVSLLFFIGFKIINLDNKRLTIAESTELTLKETIVLGLDTAEKWNENAVFHKLTSSDENRGGTRGNSGKRYDWNLFFIVPDTDKQLLVGISKGAIDLEREVIVSGDAIPIELDDIKLDSPDLLKIVKKNTIYVKERIGLQDIILH